MIYDAPALARAWDARRTAFAGRRIFIEDLAPPARAGLLLALCGGCPRTAFGYAHDQALGANPHQAPAWIGTCRVLAGVKIG